jgi:hypothetical protein
MGLDHADICRLPAVFLSLGPQPAGGNVRL